MADTNKKYLIVGLGITGMSVVRYFDRIGASFEVAETNAERFELQKISEPLLGNIRCHSSELTAELLGGFDCVVVSPGVSVRTDVFRQARDAGVEVIGDVELFAQAVTRPVLAVTGSNGKSTVVSMAGELLKAADINASVVGNVGFACLDSLRDESVQVYVLELSSFQLETTTSLKPVAASVLNISADHLDRYDGLNDYAEVKRTIYHNAQHVVFNLDDQMTIPSDLSAYKSAMSFSAANQDAAWSIKNGAVLSGPNAEIPSSAVKVAGMHNQVNALAAMAMTSVLIDSDKKQTSDSFTRGFANFTGLPHRTRLVCTADDVSWINDSKGTNVGAAVSAIKGMSSPVVLIAGGRGKNADYKPLSDVVAELCSAVVLIGEDAEKIQQAIGEVVPVFHAESMEQAVKRASEISNPGDCVLLSPACASFDMFENFEARGDEFESEVKKLCA